jgi:hypothetical protein
MTSNKYQPIFPPNLHTTNMEQTKHTPGPWHVIPKGATFAGDIANERGEVVAQAYGTGHKANARLIAAAPDLLAALQWAMDNAEWSNDTATGTDPIRAAIAKATAPK